MSQGIFDTDDLDDMINEINAVAEGIEMAPDMVRQVLQEYIPRWRQAAPVDSGRLRQSIRVIAQGGNYGISMLDYGWYNLYGDRKSVV